MASCEKSSPQEYWGPTEQFRSFHLVYLNMRLGERISVSMGGRSQETWKKSSKEKPLVNTSYGDKEPGMNRSCESAETELRAEWRQQSNRPIPRGAESPGRRSPRAPS